MVLIVDCNHTVPRVAGFETVHECGEDSIVFHLLDQLGTLATVSTVLSVVSGNVADTEDSNAEYHRNDVGPFV